MSGTERLYAAIRQAAPSSADSTATLLVTERIYAHVLDGDACPEASRHEVAAEISHQVMEAYSAAGIAAAWVNLDAKGRGRRLYDDGDDDTERIRLDVFAVVERMTHAGLVEQYAQHQEELRA